MVEVIINSVISYLYERTDAFPPFLHSSEACLHRISYYDNIDHK